MKKSILILSFIILFLINAKAQFRTGTPPINNYDQLDYYAELLNWDCVQDNRGQMFFANNAGVLIFDGKTWNLIPFYKKQVNSLKIDNNGKVLVGARNELGYLDLDSNTSPFFVSLKYLIPEKPALDFFLFICEREMIDLEDFVKKLRNVSSILAVFPFEAEEFDSAGKLVFN